MTRRRALIVAALALLCLACFGAPVRAQTRTAQQQLAVDIYKELVEINTGTATGATAPPAEAMAARLRAGGLSASDVQVFTSSPRKGNLWRGCGGRGRASRSFCSRISTWWKRDARTGRSTRSS